MSLITFSVIGKDKSPLYLRDFDHASLYEQHLEGDDDDEEEDPFGFCEHKKNLNESSSLKNQVRKQLLYSYRTRDFFSVEDNILYMLTRPFFYTVSESIYVHVHVPNT
jgi:hypothetical protein